MSPKTKEDADEISVSQIKTNVYQIKISVSPDY